MALGYQYFLPTMEVPYGASPLPKALYGASIPTPRFPDSPHCVGGLISVSLPKSLAWLVTVSLEPQGGSEVKWQTWNGSV